MAGEATYEVVQDGSDISVTCTVGEGDKQRRHKVVLHADSKPSHDSERSYAEMSDEEIVELERVSFADFLAAQS